mmetsp:Transcript_31771/g.101623  ORF Transcript_31771/g.101623 Transcript_31771/m.101623 type:complete len:616 (+) Transcript_31771:337-2184(+)
MRGMLMSTKATSISCEWARSSCSAASPSAAVCDTVCPEKAMTSDRIFSRCSESSTSITRKRRPAAGGLASSDSDESRKPEQVDPPRCIRTEKEQLVPQPSPSLRSSSLPPSSATAFAAMASPSPIPPPSAVEEREYGCVARCSSSASIPRPVSATSKCASHTPPMGGGSLSSLTEIVTEPEVVNLIAFVRRLSRARISREASTRTCGRRGSKRDSSLTSAFAVGEASSSRTVRSISVTRSTSSSAKEGISSASLPPPACCLPSPAWSSSHMLETTRESMCVQDCAIWTCSSRDWARDSAADSSSGVAACETRAVACACAMWQERTSACSGVRRSCPIVRAKVRSASARICSRSSCCESCSRSSWLWLSAACSSSETEESIFAQKSASERRVSSAGCESRSVWEASQTAGKKLHDRAVSELMSWPVSGCVAWLKMFAHTRRREMTMYAKLAPSQPMRQAHSAAAPSLATGSGTAAVARKPVIMMLTILRCSRRPASDVEWLLPEMRARPGVVCAHSTYRSGENGLPYVETTPTPSARDQYATHAIAAIAMPSADSRRRSAEVERRQAMKLIVTSEANEDTEATLTASIGAKAVSAGGEVVITAGPSQPADTVSSSS